MSSNEFQLISDIAEYSQSSIAEAKELPNASINNQIDIDFAKGPAAEDHSAVNINANLTSKPASARKPSSIPLSAGNISSIPTNTITTSTEGNQINSSSDHLYELSNTSKKAKNPKLVHRPNSSKTSKRKKA
jgi:hypothetical protein